MKDIDRERKLLGVGIASIALLTYPFISVIDLNSLFEKETSSITYIYVVWVVMISIVAVVVNFKSRNKL